MTCIRILTVLLASVTTIAAAAQSATCFSAPKTPYTLTSACCDYWGHCREGDNACNPTTVPPKYHVAQDIVGAANDVIVAAADGVVRRAATHEGYGGTVLIEHTLNGETMVSLYAHLDPARLLVAAGQTITRGTPVGYLGTSTVNGGTPPHLHFGVRKGPFANVNDACGWLYHGYTTCTAEKTQWYRPQDLMTMYPCGTSSSPTPAVTCGSDSLAAPAIEAPLMGARSAFSECVNYAGDEDWFSFFGEQGQVVNFRIYPASGSAWQTQMALKRWATTSDGINAATEASGNTSIRTNEAHVVNHTLTMTGRFYLKMRGAGDVTGPYVLERPDFLNRDGGNTPNEAATVGLPFGRSEFINFPNDEDYYKFTVQAGQRVRFDAYNRNESTYSEKGRPLQMQLAIFSSTNVRMSSSNSGTNGNAWTETQALAAGTYCVKIRAEYNQVGYYYAEGRILP